MGIHILIPSSLCVVVFSVYTFINLLKHTIWRWYSNKNNNEETCAAGRSYIPFPLLLYDGIYQHMMLKRPKHRTGQDMQGGIWLMSIWLFSRSRWRWRKSRTPTLSVDKGQNCAIWRPLNKTSFITTQSMWVIKLFDYDGKGDIIWTFNQCMHPLMTRQLTYSL